MSFYPTFCCQLCLNNTFLTLCRIAILDAVYPQDKPEHVQDAEYGSGMIASFKKNEGEVFCAGTSEWVVGLIKHETMTELITRNVLDKVSGKKTTN